MLQKLIIVRHGDYNVDLLTELGEKQIGWMSFKLSEETKGKKIFLASSVAPRAMLSSDILMKILRIPKSDYRPEQHLLSHRGVLKDDQIRVVLALIKEKSSEYEVIILVTHLEFITYLPNIWGSTKSIRIGIFHDTEKGDAVIIDTETGKCTHLQNEARR